MANSSIGTAWIQIKPTTKGIASDLKKEFSSAADEVEGSGNWTGLGTGIATKVGAAFAAAWAALKIGSTIVDTIKASIENFSDYEQLAGGIESMFKNVKQETEFFSTDYVQAIKRDAANAWKTLTMSQNDYLRSFSSTYPLVKSSIDDVGKAIETTNRMLRLESDLANTFGYDIETAANAINWALKGSFNYIDNLNIGIKGTKQGMLEAAKNCGYLVDSVNDLTSDQILDILEKTADQYGVMGKTAEEASTTIAGSYKMMKSTWDNLLTSLGTDAIDSEQAAQEFIDAFTNFLTLIEPVIEQIVEQLLPVIGEILGKVGEKIGEWAENSDSTFALVIKGLADGVIFIGAVITGLGAIFGVLVAFFENMINVVKGACSIIGSFFENIGYALSEVWNFVKGLGELVVSFFENIGNALSEVWNFIKGVADGIGNVINGIGDFFGGIGQGIGDFFGGIFGHAEGGIVGGVGTSTSDSNIVALSKGEYVINAASARQIGYGNLEAMNATGQVFGGNTNITINGYNRDPEELANIISRKIALREREIFA